MLDNFDIEKLIGEFESYMEDDEKVSDLKEQIKVITKNKNDAMKEYAKEMELPKGILSEAYSHFKKMKKGETDPEELYEIIARIDMALEEEKQKEEKKNAS